MAMIKLTNTICEQCQHYARHTARKLSDNDYFTVLDRTRSFNVSKKVCDLFERKEITNVVCDLVVHAGE